MSAWREMPKDGLLELIGEEDGTQARRVMASSEVEPVRSQETAGQWWSCVFAPLAAGALPECQRDRRGCHFQATLL